MREALISGFIDDELGLEEKIDFVEAVHADDAYKGETVALLQQEQTLRLDPVEMVPPVVASAAARRRYLHWLRPLMLGLASAAALFILWVMVAPDSARDIAQPTLSKSHRFIIYNPDIQRAELSGSFTDWRPVEMQRIGATGYWELRLDLGRGEHRFAYILDGSRRITDPTVSAREKDDFGGENSILSVPL